MLAPRSQLGEVITTWIGANPQLRVTEFVVTQSSDSEFHCLTITVFYRDRAPTADRTGITDRSRS